MERGGGWRVGPYLLGSQNTEYKAWVYLWIWHCVIQVFSGLFVEGGTFCVFHDITITSIFLLPVQPSLLCPVQVAMQRRFPLLHGRQDKGVRPWVLFPPGSVTQGYLYTLKRWISPFKRLISPSLRRGISKFKLVVGWFEMGVMLPYLGMAIQWPFQIWVSFFWTTYTTIIFGNSVHSFLSVKFLQWISCVFLFLCFWQSCLYFCPQLCECDREFVQCLADFPCPKKKAMCR